MSQAKTVFAMYWVDERKDLFVSLYLGGNSTFERRVEIERGGGKMLVMKTMHHAPTVHAMLCCVSGGEFEFSIEEIEKVGIVGRELAEKNRQRMSRRRNRRNRRAA